MPDGSANTKIDLKLATKLAELAGLDTSAYESRRRKEAALLEWRPAVLDEEVKKVRQSTAASAAHAVPADPEIPRQFVLNNDGLWHGRTSDNPGEFVAGQFQIVGEASDQGGENRCVVIRWIDRDGILHTSCIERRLAHGDGAAIAARLEAAGLHCGTSRYQHEYLSEFFSRVTPNRRLRSVVRTGWQFVDGGHVFVHPSGEASGPGKENVMLLDNASEESNSFTASGSLDEWKKELAVLAVGNDRMAFFISASFTGPLLEMAAEPSGGVHLFGKSQSGKTGVLRSAGSVWGRTSQGGVITQWRGTDNGLEGRAASRSDTILLLDEMGQADARTLDSTTYMLFNEAGKQRANRNGEARRLASWRLLVLRTGETTLGAKMAEVTKKPMTGLNVRLVDLPSDAGAGMGVFQDLHGWSSAQALAVHLRQMAGTYYGTAARAFISELAAQRTQNEDQLKCYIDDGRKRFLKENVPVGSDGQVVSVATRFALIATAGELGDAQQ